MHLNEHVKAVAYFKAQHALAISLKLAHMQSDAALNMGVALSLHVRAGRLGTATGADQASDSMSAVRTWTMRAVSLAGFVLTVYHAHVLLHLGLGHTLLAMFGLVGAVLAGLMVNLSAVSLAGFVLTVYHAHVLLHLGLGHTQLAMFGLVGAVLAGLMVNLWFMAGQRYVMEFLARFEPTSGVAEWVHATVFGISQERIDAAYRAPGPHSPSSASECLNDRVREAAKWLQAAFDGGRPYAKLHLAHLTFAGQEDEALAHLKEHLSWRVQWGRDVCSGCGQTRGEDTPMLTCSGCRVARFCSADHQKMASKKAALGGSLWTGRHKDICGVLRKWREVVKDGVSPDSCTADLVAFLQRENARCP
jgi:hypothetical protein